MGRRAHDRSNKLIRALVVLVLLACAQLPAQIPPSENMMLYYWYGGGPRQPSTMHHYIFEMMGECLGIEGEPFGDIRWISADFVMRSDYRRLAGLWISEPRTIVLSHQTWGDPAVISHEIIHDLMRLGNADHDRSEFTDCAIKDWVP